MAELRNYEPTLRDRVAYGIGDILAMFGQDPYYANKMARNITGYGGEKIDYGMSDMGLLDFTPLALPFDIEDTANALEREDYVGAAGSAVGAAGGMLPLAGEATRPFLRKFVKEEAGSLQNPFLNTMSTDDAVKEVERMYADPSSVTPQQYEEANKALLDQIGGLDLSVEARNARADAMFPEKTFHGTPRVFDQFDMNRSDVGVHSGTLDQAHARANAMGNHGSFMSTSKVLDAIDDPSYTLPLFSESTNIRPMRAYTGNEFGITEDAGSWNYPARAAEILAEHADAIDRPDLVKRLMEIRNDYKSQEYVSGDIKKAAFDDIRKALNDRGYDSVRYHNDIENYYGGRARVPGAEAKIDELRAESNRLSREINAALAEGDAARKLDPYAFTDGDRRLSGLLAARQKAWDETSSVIDTIERESSSLITMGLKNLRSTSARFDPRFRNLAHPLAGVGGAAATLDHLLDLSPEDANAEIEAYLEDSRYR